MKTCKICKQGKPLSNFHRNAFSEDGHRARCKACENAERKRKKQPDAGLFKLCTRCGRLLPKESFGAVLNIKSGLASHCKECGARIAANWRKDNPEKYASSRRLQREQKRQRYANDSDYREASRQHNHDRYHALPLDEKRRQGHRNHLHTAYRLTPEQWLELLAKQDGVCGCCGKLPQPTRKNPRGLEVDHDHKTKKVRGLLCHRCNTGIAILGDDFAGLWQAIAYLEDQ